MRAGRSEFEKDGVHNSGVFGKSDAHEKLTIMKRTEEDPNGLVDLDAEPDKFEHGGIHSLADLIRGIPR